MKFRSSRVFVQVDATSPTSQRGQRWSGPGEADTDAVWGTRSVNEYFRVCCDLGP